MRIGLTGRCVSGRTDPPVFHYIESPHSIDIAAWREAVRLTRLLESPYVSLTASVARVSLAGRTLLPQEGSDAGPGGEALGNPPPGF